MSIEEIKEILKRDSMQEAVLIGLEEDRENYYPAIIKCDEEKGVVTYDYELLAECFANEFFNPSEDRGSNRGMKYLPCIPST